MARETRQAEQKIAAVISMVSVKTRRRVDSLAAKNRVSRSEIGRRAIEQYVARTTSGRRE
jgi:predicted transcriptional regulator